MLYQEGLVPILIISFFAALVGGPSSGYLDAIELTFQCINEVVVTELYMGKGTSTPNYNSFVVKCLRNMYADEKLYFAYTAFYLSAILVLNIIKETLPKAEQEFIEKFASFSRVVLGALTAKIVVWMWKGWYDDHMVVEYIEWLRMFDRADVVHRVHWDFAHDLYGSSNSLDVTTQTDGLDIVTGKRGTVTESSLLTHNYRVDRVDFSSTLTGKYHSRSGALVQKTSYTNCYATKEGEISCFAKCTLEEL